MTDEQRAVMIAAIEVAIAAPVRPAANVHATLVPWSTVLDLRAALVGAGIDWRDVKTQQAARDAAGR